ncbi:acyloxyacyl hydrolase [Ruegeria sp.]|uniref:acyloxyacyl hydrolase n=1 Tax=Ruegeria sp. TaxID=1879320 RepID=UPI002323ED87|nr:acyloxyacyl hydrolase [Ruegeria sp.]MDA7964688.1 acyloxyacyl hydrolase [Ruegeria sp.]
MRSLIIAALGLLAAGSVQAQSIIFGAGYADFSDSQSVDQALFSLEYQHRPFHEATRFSATWGAAVSVDEDGDTHIGAGLVGIYAFNNRWFVEGSVMPGYYDESNALNDLGGSFQIRSLIGLGYTLNSGNKVSVALTHKSNASTQEDNPGVNAVLLRYHYSF